MRKCVALVIPALLGMLVAAAPAELPPAELTRLVAQLGDEDFQKREQATELLRQQGLAALPALRAAVEHPDVEVRRRVQILLPPLEKAILIGPRRVSLDGKNRTCRQILDDLAKQTGYSIGTFDQDQERQYSIELKDATFWEALDRICKETGMSLQPGFGSDRICLRANAGSPYVHYKGAFRFAAESLTQVRNLDLSAPVGEAQRSNSLSFSFSVWAEPRLPILSIGEPHIDAAYDSDKHSMLPPPSEPNEDMPVRRRFSTSRRFSMRSITQSVELPLIRPSEKSQSIKSIRGTVPLTLLVSQKQVLISDKPLEDRNKKVVIDQLTFILEEVTQLPSKEYQVSLSVKDEGDGTMMNSLYQRIEVLDGKGNKLSPNGSSWRGGADNVRLTMMFGAQGGKAPEAPTRISFQSWTTLVHHQEFEFRDIPLP